MIWILKSCEDNTEDTLSDLRKWISEAGLKIMYEYSSYNKDTINEETMKAIIWAVKE